jgi:hypothetical protein
MLCANVCVDPKTDTANCGTCGTACLAGEQCVAGACVCPAGSQVCGNACVSIATDPDNCGACDNPCLQGEVCKAGACECAAGICQGDNLCTTLKDTPQACGSCGAACNDDQTCAGGACVCRPSLAMCGGNCVDFKHDADNCGSCGNVCTQGTNPRCVDGVCMDTTCSGINRTLCGNNGCFTATQLQSDPLNCGGCGFTCQTTEVCVLGMCQTYFPSPSCTACPCDACGSTTKCCKVGGKAVCVAGDTCPP